jgi:hypothetical protein
MNDLRRLARPGPALVALILCALMGSRLTKAQALAPDAVVYRIFLSGGGTLASYGEFARVGDRVIFSMPVGATGGKGAPPLQLVSIPASAVDWTTTDRYSESARAAHYAETRGESDFAVLSSQVAWALNEIGLTADPAKRLQLADRARRVLSDWERTSYGYRAKDVAELATFVDEIISELRAASGADSFELSFVANVAPPPSMPLMSSPSLRESIEQALTAARLTTEPAERIQLLRTAVGLLDTADLAADPWSAPLRTRATGELAAEMATERSYADLSERVLRAAAARAKAADARGLEALVGQVLKKDDELGRRRPNAVSALLATLDGKLDAARRLRLARDRWSLEVGAFRAYRRQIDDALNSWKLVGPAMEDVRSLAGPSPQALQRVEARIGEVRAGLAGVEAPAPLRSVQAMLASALQLAASASRLRRDAVTRQDMAVAWNASAAAAGALMLFDRADRELRAALKPPELQ